MLSFTFLILTSIQLTSALLILLMFIQQAAVRPTKLNYPITRGWVDLILYSPAVINLDAVRSTKLNYPISSGLGGPLGVSSCWLNLDISVIFTSI